jgi:class 3 adenylate cyclase
MSALRTILVVDDTAQNIQMIAAVLKDAYRVKVATSGEKALAMLAGPEKPDLVLLDVTMPGMDGYEVCRRMKEDARTADVPVIFLTANTEVDRETKGFEVGAVDYIHKPFSPAVVKARVATHLALRDALREAEDARKAAHELLEVLLPAAAAAELRATGSVVPRRHEGVAVLFCDVVNFTSYCDQHEPEDVVARLDALFVRFDRLAREHGLEKIKTIGDAFMGVANLLLPNDRAVESAVSCGLAMAAAAPELGFGWSVRVGVHAGPVVAGVVGEERYQFDIWGDTVNMAARILTLGRPGAVVVTGDLWPSLEGRFLGESLGVREIKGKEPAAIYEITGVRAS